MVMYLNNFLGVVGGRWAQTEKLEKVEPERVEEPGDRLTQIIREINTDK